MSEGSRIEWGRVDDDGTVYVRTSTGERAVGSWRAGSAEEGLAHFARRFEDLAAEVGLLESRLKVAGADPNAVAASARRLRASLDTAAVVGNLAALDARLAAVDSAAQLRRASLAVEKADRAAKVLAAKEELVTEAERIAKSSEWKGTGERYRTLVEQFRAAGTVDKRTESDLWRRLTTAREEFARRRTAHFAALDHQRAVSRQRKEAIIVEAEKLTDSTDWATTTARYRTLMTEWKAAGRAAKDVDDALWTQFRAAQDAFFSRRNAANAERDAELVANQAKKEALLAEAAALDPADVERSQRTFRKIQERWDAAGRAPRDTAPDLERRLGEIAERLRDAADAKWERAELDSSPFVAKLRESVARLEQKLERARAAGRTKDAAEAEAALATQRAWLSQASR